jgi:hypothetical protein
MSLISDSFGSPGAVYNPGYYDNPKCDAYSNNMTVSQSRKKYPTTSGDRFNTDVQKTMNGAYGGYNFAGTGGMGMGMGMNNIMPANMEPFIGSQESTYKYVSNSGYNTDPFMMAIHHSNDQFPAQVYTNTNVQLRIDPRMSSSKMEDSAYKAKSQMMGGGYGAQFAPSHPYSPGLSAYSTNPMYHNPSAGYGQWHFEPPYSEPQMSFPPVPVQQYMPMAPMTPTFPNMMPQMSQPMMPMQQQPHPQMMGGGAQGAGPRPKPSIRMREAREEDEEDESDELSTSIRKLKKKMTTMEKVNAFLKDNNTFYWLLVLLVILVVAFVIKVVYVDNK